MSEATAKVIETPTRAVPGGVPAAVGAPVALAELLRWTGARIGAMLPIIVIVQVLLGVGIVVGFGLVIPNVDQQSALFLATGAPTTLLLTVGLVLVPQQVATARTDGTFTYLRTLPVPRSLVFLADLVVWSVIALPGVVVGLLVAWVRFDLTLSFDWLVLVPAAILVTVMATAVGYAIAVAFRPVLAQMLSQVLVFFVLLFSPIMFPAARLPEWFQIVHDVLPVQAGADLVRAGLAADAFSAQPRDFIVLVAWTAVGLVISLRAMLRRA